MWNEIWIEVIAPPILFCNISLLCEFFMPYHYRYDIMSEMASQITDISIIYTTVCSGADQRKHQSSVALAFVKEKFTGDRWIPAQRTSNTENDSIWWRHQGTRPCFSKKMAGITALVQGHYSWFQIMLSRNYFFFWSHNMRHNTILYKILTKLLPSLNVLG